MGLRGISFDLWDTLVVDDSDELVRAERGLRSKHDERRWLVWQAAQTCREISLADVSAAVDAVEAEFRRVWHEEHINWPCRERLERMMAALNLRPQPDVFEHLLTETAHMEVRIPPRLIEGCEAALEALCQDYRLGITSDAIVTPGLQLREIMKNHGIFRYFSHFSFSDEVGHSKPHRSMFEATAAGLGVALSEMVHIGDREHNDVLGPKALGMKSIMFAASRTTDREGSTAEAICDHFRDLPGLIKALG